MLPEFYRKYFTVSTHPRENDTLAEVSCAECRASIQGKVGALVEMIGKVVHTKDCEQSLTMAADLAAFRAGRKPA